MITTGSKLFFGATVLSVVAAVVFAVTNGGPTGFMGTVGLVSAAIGFTFLAGINQYCRDSTVPASQAGVQHNTAASQAPVQRSAWPLVAALGLAGLVVGVVSHPSVFKVSFVVLLAAFAEWLIQAWSERASADETYNRSVRARLLHPLEFPVLATVGLGAVIYAFSRIMLSASKTAGLWIFMVLGTIVVAAAFVLASKRSATRKVIGTVCTVSAVALLGVGVVSAVGGQRSIEVHPELTRGVCLEEVGEEEMHHADEDANRNVSAQSSVTANIELQENGTLIAWVNGFNAEGDQQHAQSTLQIPRSTRVGVLFHSSLEGEHRLTARLGTFGEDPEIVLCTPRLEEGRTAYLSLLAPKTNAASSTELVLFVPNLPDQKITLVVP
jgi:multisubunit Na+/H+ antiporter MnhC subunit